MTAGVAEMAVNGTAAATVVQGQEPSGTAKAAAGATPMDGENLSEMLRAQTTADIYGWRFLENAGANQ